MAINDICPICLDHLAECTTELECKHHFHTKCFIAVVERASKIDGTVLCPMCRSQICQLQRHVIINIDNSGSDDNDRNIQKSYFKINLGLLGVTMSWSIYSFFFNKRT